jgi:ferrochelatase
MKLLTSRYRAQINATPASTRHRRDQLDLIDKMLCSAPLRRLTPSLSRAGRTALQPAQKTRALATLTSTSAPFASAAPPVTQDATSRRGPTAMVLMNMGGPAALDQVGDFLSRLFSDGDLIPLGRLQNYLGPLISARRTGKIQKQYAEIGGGSPIRKWSEYQAIEMCRLLDGLSPETAPHRPYVAFRYADPLTEEMYQQLHDDGFGRGRGGRAVAFTQYPQYSCSTTGSSLNELWRCRQLMEGRAADVPNGADGSIQWSVIDRWPVHPGLTEAIAQNIEGTIATYPEQDRDKITLLFSAHSLPMSVVNRGESSGSWYAPPSTRSCSGSSSRTPTAWYGSLRLARQPGWARRRLRPWSGTCKRGRRTWS